MSDSSTTDLLSPLGQDNAIELAMFGGRTELRELAERLTKMMPGANRLTFPEALAVAQVAIAHGLDPFNGEVWGLKRQGKDNKPDEWYGVMVGIKGTRKSARREAKANQSSFWTEFRQVPASTYGEPESALVYECIVRDTAQIMSYGKAIHALTSAGVPYADAVTALGPAPRYVGVGIATPSEFSKMHIHARARKRAEADALKQAYDLNFAGAFTEGDVVPEDAMPAGLLEDSNTVNGQFVEQPEVEAEAAAMTTAQALLDLGYTEQV